MSYIEQSLGANESVHYTAQFPTARYVLAWLALTLGLVAGLAAFLQDRPIAAAALAIVGLALLCWLLYRPWTTEIAVTNLRLIYKRGFFQRHTNDLQLRAIEEVRLHQDFWGRLFNYGSVQFYGTGVADLRLPAIKDPVAFQKAIQEALGADQNSAELPDHLTMPSSRAS